MKKILIILYVLSYFNTVYSQISSGGIPLSFNKKDIPNNIQLIDLGAIDAQFYLEEDKSLIAAGDYPYRYGVDIPVSYNLHNSGQWHSLADGGGLWRLKIKSAGAYSLNFIMSNFYLSEGARLYLYNETGQFIGGFTSANNTKEKEFATAPLSGDIVTFELYEPADTRGQSTLEISYIIHAYRNIFGTAQGNDKSGSCNININCPEGAVWQNEKRAVALILTANNTSICTGALVNNARQDGTPYFLTANHCLTGSASNTWIFMFNFESNTCVGGTGPINQTVQGSVLRAKDSPSDFALLELTTAPPPAYNVYFAGWSHIDEAADSAVCIHHPSGDVKKISLDYDTVVSTGYSGTGNDHWRVLSWDLGTTEGGSSGSPLFNKHKKVVGQLHGGTASCTNPSGYDVFGKFAYSWNTGASADKRLKDWLDPDDTGVTDLEGADFNSPLYDYDAMLSQIIEPTGTDLCQLEVSPRITIRNNGNEVLSSLKINYKLNNQAVQFINWNGQLNYQEFTDIDMPLLTLTEGQQELKVFLSTPNDTTDQNYYNDTLSVEFNAFVGNEVTLELTTDNYPEETSWKLLDTLGNELYVSTTLSSETSYSEKFCLYNGCYNFVILDTYGDGLSGGGWWNPSPPGTYSINFMGNVLGADTGNFGYSDTIYFCVNSVGIAGYESEKHISIYPNPAYDYINISIDDFIHSAYLEIYSINGQLLGQFLLKGVQNKISTSFLGAGVYFLKLSYGDREFRKRLVLMK